MRNQSNPARSLFRCPSTAVRWRPPAYTAERTDSCLASIGKLSVRKGCLSRTLFRPALPDSEASHDRACTQKSLLRRKKPRPPTLPVGRPVALIGVAGTKEWTNSRSNIGKYRGTLTTPLLYRAKSLLGLLWFRRVSMSMWAGAEMTSPGRLGDYQLWCWTGAETGGAETGSASTAQ